MDERESDLFQMKEKSKLQKRLKPFNSDCGQIFAIHIRFGGLFNKILLQLLQLTERMMEWMNFASFHLIWGRLIEHVLYDFSRYGKKNPNEKG